VFAFLHRLLLLCLGSLAGSSSRGRLAVLLYAQPLSRVVRLTLDDVIRDGDQVLVRLGEPLTPVPGRPPSSCWNGSAAGAT
jgi:hypothetical protein